MIATTERVVHSRGSVVVTENEAPLPLQDYEQTTNGFSYVRTVHINDLGHPKYRLGWALPVALEVDDTHVVAYSYDLDILGWGEVEHEALNDFKTSLCELFETLREDRENLGPHAQNVLRYLENVISEAT